MARVELQFADSSVLRSLLGQRDVNLKQLEQQLDIDVAVRGNTVQVGGSSDQVRIAQTVLQQLYEVCRKGFPVYENDIQHAVRMVRSDQTADLGDIFLDTVFVSSSKKVVVPKTANQKRYIDAIRNHDVVFGIGPAGTGKTYLAMAMALSALTRHQVKRIVLVRPAVEAGEKLGFLPGDMAEKVNPYLRPLHDALYDMMEMERASELMEKGTIEVAPLAFMRGRTLNGSFVILDEAQNTTREQMKMFLTRLGFSSRAVVTGDLTQTDLPDVRRSGLNHASRILRNVSGISFVQFDQNDVVRHPLVQKIILAYETAAKGRGKSDPARDERKHPDS